MAALYPCAICARHVRATEACCPFCWAVLPPPPPPRRAPARGLGRAAVFAFGGAALAQSAGCYDHHLRGAPVERLTRPDAALEASVTALPDARPPREPDASVYLTPDGGADVGGFLAMYGGPTPIEPADAGTDAGELPLPGYGTPPDPTPELDAGAPDDAPGSVVNLYGAPPEP